MTTPLFLLRSVEQGISIRDWICSRLGWFWICGRKKANDGVKYKRIATQEDFDKF